MATTDFISIAAAEILNNLGGRKFIAMTGSKNFISSSGIGRGELTMKLTKNIANATHLIITVNEKDLYDMSFIRVTMGKTIKRVEVAHHENIGVEILQKMFTKVTGLDTRL